jgi:HD-GYP domain-containing protein (c-di-GMP phosphodiesterase class II)/sensor domain CHASE-containing protein
MTLRKKTLLIIGLTLVTLLAALFMPAYRIIGGSFSELERRETIQDVNRVVDSLTDNGEQLSRITQDWASWDDTYAFVQDSNEAFISSNLELETSWINNELNVMVFLDEQAESVYADAFDHDDVEKIPVPTDLLPHLQLGSPLLEANEERAVKGILMLEQGPMLVASEPILTSEREGPSRGWLVWGRFLDDAQVQHLAEVTHLSVAMQRLDQEMTAEYGAALASIDNQQPVSISPTDEDTIAGYAVLKDIYGNDAIMMRIENPREIIGQGRSMMRYMLGMILAATLLSGAGTFYLLERSVLSRVSRLSSEVSAIGEMGDHSIRIEMSGKDELTRFADVINKALAALENSQHELKKAHDELELKVEERTAALRDKVAVLQALTDIDRQVMGMNDSHSILELVARRSAELMHCDLAQISLRDSASHSYVAAAVGLAAHDDNAEEINRDLPPDAIVEPPHLVAASTEEETIRLIPGVSRREHVKSAAIAPLVAEGKVHGSLMVAAMEPRIWNTDDLQVLRLLSAEAALSYDEARLFEEEQARREELGSLYSLSRSLVEASPQRDEILDLVTRHAVEKIHVTFARVLVSDDEHFVIGAGYPVRTLGVNINNGMRETLGSMPVCSRLLTAEGPVVLSIDDPDIDDKEKQLLFMDVAHRLCVVPIRGERVYGLLMLGEARSDVREPFSPEKIRLAHSVGDQTASALRRAELFSELERSYLDTVMTLAKAVEAKDTYTADHAERLAEMSLAIGAAMNMNAAELEDLSYGATLHDVGKIGVPDDILQKPGKLNDEEWQKMRQHPQIGADILDPVPRLRGAAQIVRHHHERFDGNGYPDGLKGDEIPLGARILTVVDSYSAIVDERIYKKARSHEEALAELERCNGTQFDPEVVRLFVELSRQGTLH